MNTTTVLTIAAVALGAVVLAAAVTTRAADLYRAHVAHRAHRAHRARLARIRAAIATETDPGRRAAWRAVRRHVLQEGPRP